MKGKDGQVLSQSGRVYLDPGIQAVTQYTASVVREIVARYEIDGVNLDNVRYPSVIGGYNEMALAGYRNESGSAETPDVDDKEWCKWRCNQVTSLVRAVQQAANTTNSSVKLSASVLLANPEYAARLALQEWDVWIRQGLVDFVIPMVYPKDDTMSDSATCALKHSYDRHVYIGIGSYRLSRALTEKQIADCRAQGAKGVVLYSYHYLCDTMGGRDLVTSAELAASAFSEDAQVPDMPWR